MSETVSSDELSAVSADELELLIRYWNAANYLTAARIYLGDNPLLRTGPYQHVGDEFGAPDWAGPLWRTSATGPTALPWPFVAADNQPTVARCGGNRGSDSRRRDRWLGRGVERIALGCGARLAHRGGTPTAPGCCWGRSPTWSSGTPRAQWPSSLWTGEMND